VYQRPRFASPPGLLELPWLGMTASLFPLTDFLCDVAFFYFEFPLSRYSNTRSRFGFSSRGSLVF